MRAMNSPPSRGLPRSFFFIVFLFLGLEDPPVGAQPGFISVDCGLPDGPGYLDNATGITYVPDAQYVDTGETKTVAGLGIPRPYRTLRVFPEGVRNCYNLQPVQPGDKYLVRVGFFYGDYDGLQSPPEFELHIGVHARLTIRLLSNIAIFYEVIAVAQGDTIWVCLVNTNKGTPLISTIEVRLLPNSSYPLAKASQSLQLDWRVNFGTEGRLRYPEDPFDRIWVGAAGNLPVINTTRTVEATTTDPFQVPSLVMRTAISVPNASYALILSAAVGDPDDIVYAVLHFAELQNLTGTNQTRIMDIRGKGSDNKLVSNYSAPFLEADHVELAGSAVGQTGIYNISLRSSNSSTLPPMINALESFLVRKVDELPTDLGDVRAIQDIRTAYKLKRNWQGDPCVPKNYTWDGLRCNYYDGLETPRIISLNLSSSGLVGGITGSIANLTALTSLDLSNNSLSGTFPVFLTKLPALKSLNLVGNNIILPYEDLCEKLSNRRLSLRIEGLEELCSIQPSSNSPSPSSNSPRTSSSFSNKQKYLAPISITTSLVLLVVILM